MESQESHEELLRAAGRDNRRVMIRFENTPGQEVEREMEPYRIEDDVLHAFSYYRNEFRTLPLADIRGVQVTARTFTPRKPVDL
jgi:predicted DNA-binding transcriptional regulator YafY